MEKFKQILLDVWREACRNIEITESLPIIANMLNKHLPLYQILMCRIDCIQSSLNLMAMGFKQAETNLKTIKKYNQSQITKLKAWHHKKEIIHNNFESDNVLSLFFSSEEKADIIAGPLGKYDDQLPVLILIAEPNSKFEMRHFEMVKILLEPFTIAIENDFRLKEIIKLREAAEADKKTLLAKLSRNSIGDIIIGANNGLKTVMDRVMIVAKSDVPVLIFGETGTGKELIARAIHNNSDRNDGPFIRVNCGAIPAELIDSQLFGHERGAFTGAVESRKGWFERANEGTLFLDEVGELPLNAQVRFLRILQDGWLERVGGKNPIKVDVRIVLATHRDLASMVAQGSFREDLWYRISTFPIFLPPLRERTQDLKILAEHFAKRSATRFGLSVILPTDNDINLLASYHWPGNIRELGTVIDRAALLGNGQQLEIAKALGWTDTFSANKEILNSQRNSNINSEGILSLNDVIKNHIQKVLVHSKGKVEGKDGAAALLKINPHTLRARMRKLAIDWQKYRIN